MTMGAIRFIGDTFDTPYPFLVTDLAYDFNLISVAIDDILLILPVRKKARVIVKSSVWVS